MSRDSPAQRYRRRRRAPILVVIAVLVVGGAIAWFQVLKPVPAASTGCSSPGPAPVTTSRTPTTSRPVGSPASRSSVARSSTVATPTSSIVTSLGSFAGPDSLTGVRPADPAVITLQVFNAGFARGLAKTVTNDLRAAGFASILGGANDPLYPAHDLVCAAEIRYGQAGTAAARTVLLVAPCAQLVLDNRISDSVDLALGARYTYAPLSAAVTTELRVIHDSVIPPAVIEGQTAAARAPAPIPPLPSSAGCQGDSRGQ